jgi:hypothetical protein
MRVQHAPEAVIQRNFVDQGMNVVAPDPGIGESTTGAGNRFMASSRLAERLFAGSLRAHCLQNPAENVF